ncbi:hypothetical protein ES703_97945 [subsurface metagenome]
MPLRLHKATHNTEGEEQSTVLKDHGRDYGVVGPLMRLDAVGMAGLKGKQSAAVLQANAGTSDHNAGAKPLVKAIDERNAVALFIRHRQVNGVSFSIRDAGCHLLTRLIPIY